MYTVIRKMSQSMLVGTCRRSLEKKIFKKYNNNIKNNYKIFFLQTLYHCLKLLSIYSYVRIPCVHMSKYASSLIKKGTFITIYPISY